MQEIESVKNGKSYLSNTSRLPVNGDKVHEFIKEIKNVVYIMFINLLYFGSIFDNFQVEITSLKGNLSKCIMARTLKLHTFSFSFWFLMKKGKSFLIRGYNLWSLITIKNQNNRKETT